MGKIIVIKKIKLIKIFMNFTERVEKFLQKKSKKKKLIVIYGPTWSGKTDMSIDIAKQLDSEIISTDSRQIFKELNIWTGKITEDEKKWVHHHMLDIISADREFSSWEFKNESEKIIEQLHNDNKIPILCWGTGLYIDSLIFNFNIPKVPADIELREKLEKEAELHGKQYIYDKLCKIDPDYAKELHPNNLRYVIRALEVKMITGKSKRDFREEKTLKYDVLFLTPYIGNRELLYNRINKRVKMMFDEGLIQEVSTLLKKYNKNDFWMRTIWYKEVVEYLNGFMTEEECLALVQKHNRNYAKRQLTWFRKYNDYIEQ